jgi:hypothetical protein
MAPWLEELHLRTLPSEEEGCFQDFTNGLTDVQRSNASQHESFSRPERTLACRSEGDPLSPHPASRHSGYHVSSLEDTGSQDNDFYSSDRDTWTTASSGVGTGKAPPVDNHP